MPSKVERELIEVSGREVSISNPRKVLFPEAGTPSSISCTTTSPWPTARCAARAAGPTCWCAIPTASARSSSTRSARPKSRPDWIEVVALKFPSGRTAEEMVPRDAAALAWMANLACLELHPHPVLAEDLDHPNELRVDLDPVPGRRVARRCRRWRGVVRATLDRSRAGRLAEDVRVARHSRQRADPPALELRRGAPRRRGAGARSGAARAGASPPASGGRKSGTACSSTTTRTRRIAPWRRRSRCGRGRTRACRRR